MGDAPPLPGELDYISGILSGSSPQGQAPQAHRRRRRNNKNHPPNPSSQTVHSRRNGDPGAGPSNSAAAAAPSQASDDPHNQPSDKSTLRFLHCAACNVWVPHRPGDWGVHVAGIRHRRQLLSLREFGEPSKLVLSVFEGVPQAGQSSDHFASRAAIEKSRTKQKKDLQRLQLDPEVRSMRSSAMTELLMTHGRGRIYDGAMKFFDVVLLDQARAQVQELLALPNSLLKIHKGPQLFSSPAALLALQHSIKTQPSGSSSSSPTSSTSKDSEIVYPEVLILKMPKIATSVHAAAWLAGLRLVVDALKSHKPRITTLAIRVRADCPYHTRDVLHKGWSDTTQKVRALVENSTMIESMHIYHYHQGSDASDSEDEDTRMGEVQDGEDNVVGLPPGGGGAVDLGGLGEAALWRAVARRYGLPEDLDRHLVRDTLIENTSYRIAAAKLARAVRLAVLMSQHRRLGRCSVLQVLPPIAVAEIVEKTVAKAGCKTYVAMGDVGEVKMGEHGFVVAEPDQQELGWVFISGFDELASSDDDE